MPWTGPVLPAWDGIGYPGKRSIKWSWEDQTALSGKRARYSLFSYPVYQWELPINFLRTDSGIAEFQDFVAFVNSLFGGVGLFGYADPNDGAVTNQSFGAGDGVTTQFQMVRSIVGTDASFVEPVFLLQSGYAVSVAGTPTTAFTESTGVVIFNTAPANGAALTWTGSFYYPCRFDGDATDLERFVSNIYNVKSLKFSSEKLA